MLVGLYMHMTRSSSSPSSMMGASTYVACAAFALKCMPLKGASDLKRPTYLGLTSLISMGVVYVMAGALAGFGLFGWLVFIALSRVWEALGWAFLHTVRPADQLMLHPKP